MNPSNSTSAFSLGQLSGQGQNGTTNSSFSFGQTPGTGFSFGSSTQPVATATVNPLTTSSGFSFGSPTPSGGFNFGQSTPAATTTSSGGFSFLQPSASAPTPGSLSFGQSTAAPSTGLNFGQTTPVASSSGFSLGQTNPTTSTTSFSGFSFGQTNPNPVSSAPLGGFSLGQTAPSTSSSGLNFGLSAGNVPSGGLGQPASSGFSFGQPSNAASTSNAASSGLFGQATIATTPASTTPLFGQTASNVIPASTTPLFGQPAANVTPAITSASLFGQTSTTIPTTTNSLFHQSAAATPSGLFGQTSSASAQPSSGLNFGIGSGGLFGQPSNASTSTGLNFGTPAASSGFNFPSSPASSSTGFSLSSSSGGLGGAAPASSIFSSTAASAPSLNLGGSLPSSAISTSGGLGGYQTSSMDSGIGSSMSKSDGKSAKETPLPQDIFTTIAVFENYKDMEKKCSEDNIRQTATPFHKLVEDTRKLRQHIVKLSNQNTQLHSSAQKLKSSVIQEAENVEMARRTQDTPMNLQGNNKAPEQFFLRLVRSFEERMTFCRNRIEEVEKCARSNGNGNEITSDDMKEVLKKEHEMVKALAAKIYTLHNQLINYTNQSNNPDIQPEALFKPSLTDQQEAIGFSSKHTTVIRPTLGEGGSGLLNFQNGQQKAKALCLGAAPPTLPLSQTFLYPLGPSRDMNIFSGPSAPAESSLFNFSSNTANNTLGNNFSFNSKPTFGSSSTSASVFGNPTSSNLNTSGGGLFGAPNNTSLFGNAKSFKK